MVSLIQESVDGQQCLVIATPGKEYMGTWWAGRSFVRRMYVCKTGDCQEGDAVVARFSAKDELYYPATVCAAKDGVDGTGGVYWVRWTEDGIEDVSHGPVVRLLPLPGVGLSNAEATATVLPQTR